MFCFLYKVCHAGIELCIIMDTPRKRIKFIYFETLGLSFSKKMIKVNNTCYKLSHFYTFFDSYSFGNTKHSFLVCSLQKDEKIFLKLSQSYIKLK